jgi:cell wall-associated NlpC family hydrolase
MRPIRLLILLLAISLALVLALLRPLQGRAGRGHAGPAVAMKMSDLVPLRRGHRVGRRGLRPGDLVFFAGASHVGIYAGSGRFIDAPHSGAVVRITTMHGWYGASYYGARRLAAG